MIYIMADSRYDARKLADKHKLAPYYAYYAVLSDKFDVAAMYKDLPAFQSQNIPVEIWLSGAYLANPLYSLLRDIELPFIIK
jgi:hypothetical protein